MASKASKPSNAPKVAPSSRPASPVPQPPRHRSRERVPLEAQRKSALPPVRVTPAEHDEVRAKAKAMGVPMGELIRRAVLGARVQGVPAVNREIWGRMGPLLANLNIFAREVRRGRATGVPVEMIEQLRSDVDDLREYLLGRDPVETQGAAPAASPASPPPAVPRRGPGRPRKNPPPHLPAPAAKRAAPKARGGAAKAPAAKSPAAKGPAAKRSAAKSSAAKTRAGAAKRPRR